MDIKEANEVLANAGLLKVLIKEGGFENVFSVIITLCNGDVLTVKSDFNGFEFTIKVDKK